MGAEFHGTGVALVTPFDEHLRLDLPAFERLLEHTALLDYWVVIGTTGESPTLTERERREILEFVHGHNPRDLPIMYGLGGNNTQALVQQIRNTDFTNIRAILSVCPYYNKPTQEGLVRHYTMIADHCPVPVYMYNVPGRTAVNMKAETVLRLAEHPNIAGVKEASGDMEQCQVIGRDKPDDFLLISGDDISTVPIIERGGVGVISVLANAQPELMNQMVHSALDGQGQQANGYLERLLPINPLMYQEGNPVGVKKLLHLMGICDPWVRLPLVPASDELTSAIQQALEGLK